TFKKGLLEQLAYYLKPFKCVEKVELLPFHKMGEFKWKELGKNYLLYDIEQPSLADIEMAKDVFRKQGFKM
ncbi:MAG: pyruvate formate lyase 1-activating protein, partial [Oscillospiraceae bacterium]